MANLNATERDQRRPRGPKPEFPGLSSDAAELGVSRYFLWQVLKGIATSAPLRKRYTELKAAQRVQLGKSPRLTNKAAITA